jgi:DNA-binding CsgD family transcriptional regulator
MDRGDLLWLVYLVFFFIEALERGSLRFWMEWIGLVAVFVALYVAFLRATSVSVRLVLLGAMFLLGVGTYPFNAGAISFFIYAAALLPFVVPSAPTVVVCLVCESLLIAGEGWLLHRNLYTDRERQILQRAGDGRSSAEIATELRLSEGTVRNYLSEAIAKLGAANRVDAARIARQRGWL